MKAVKGITPYLDLNQIEGSNFEIKSVSYGPEEVFQLSSMVL